MSWSTIRLPATLLATAVVLAASTAAYAKIVCWKNDEGVRECGNSVPPEFAQKETEIKSNQGVTVGIKARAKTQEELAIERAEAERLAKIEAEEAEKRRLKAQQDKVLLHTYTNEDDLVMAKAGQLQAVDSRIKHITNLNERLKLQLTELQAEAAKLERGGKTVSEDLKSSIFELHKQIGENDASVARRNQEKLEIAEKFDRDLLRYRELKGIE